ncbi:MAG: hypothetical protein H6731_11365 [Myxococcales bacterium]|nr:MAG: hypothetical protein H6731_11365 [Myxococcales bacterium]
MIGPGSSNEKRPSIVNEQKENLAFMDTMSGVKPEALSIHHYDHYDMLKTVEQIFWLSDLGRSDKWGKVILDVWL